MASYQTAAELLPGWRNNVLNGTPPTLYPIGTGELARIEVGPGLVTLLGGAPGSGKTAFVMQAVIDALRITPSLRVCVCNVEMPPATLLDRQLARLGGIDLKAIRHRQLDAQHVGRIADAMGTLEAVADRLCFVAPPFDLANVAAAADGFGVELVVLDYLQRIPPPGQHGDKRGAVDATMNYLRQFTAAGVAVIVVAAVARSKDSRGRSTYTGLNLASFRESSELEYGADDAFLLMPDPKDAGLVTLQHLKARNSEAKDITLRFDRACQRFTAAGGKAELAALWDATKPAGGDK